MSGGGGDAPRRGASETAVGPAGPGARKAASLSEAPGGGAVGFEASILARKHRPVNGIRAPITRRNQFAYTWAPDSRHILTVVSAVTAPFQTLWSVPLDGGAPRALIRFDDPFTTFGRGAFAARGSTIYVTLLRSESDVWTADLVRR